MDARIKLALYALLLAAVLGTGWYIRHLQHEVKNLEADKVALQVKVDDYQVKMQALVDDAKAKQVAADAAIAAAQVERDTAQKRASSYYKAKAGTNSCDSALELINGGAK